VGRSSTTRRGPLPRPTVRADDSTLTRFAGVLPFVHFCQDLGLPSLLGQVAPCGRKRVHGVGHVLFAFVVASVLGVQRLAHLDWCSGDALLLKLLRLSSWPVRKVFSSALAGVTDAGLALLLDILTGLGVRNLAGAPAAVLDFDSTAVVSFGEQEGAEFGYSGKGRNRRRHHPLVASVAEGRTVVHARYRDGSAVDAAEATGFFAETIARVRARLPGAAISVRADSGFWSARMCAWLLDQGLPFACSMPLHAGVKLLLWMAEFTRVDGDDEDTEVATIPGAQLGMDARVKVVVVRRRVHDPGAPPPGKVVPADLEWRYQAVVTNLSWDAVDAWRFYNDRGDCERVFKVGKGALGLANLVSQDFRANTVAFLLRLVAYNADALFQRHAEDAAAAAAQPVRRVGLAARQPRLYHLAGRLLREHGRWVLRLPASRLVADLWRFYDPGGFSTA